MGQSKKEYEKAMLDELQSGIYCEICGDEIPKTEVEDADQGNGAYICSYCRQKMAELVEE